ncbi:hypothetical protein RN001_004192 [Aquatica leii]|uniref:SH2 domain-containing protein n=1 Tax=Aquatica leii TaxID=1421715 RepID=A0AAN7SPG2_9COLE|nr:hypothetical protein RN001_004192 [Aquatica leii]
MSHHILLIKRIESLNSNELAEALEFNGYGQCIAPIRSKDINGEQFLKLTEVQISLWRLPVTQSRRLWSFIQLVKSDPSQLLIKLPQNSKPNVKPYDKVNKQKDNITLPMPAASINLSTLNKQESFLFKNKLEEMFKKESEEPIKSFVHQQKYPKLPPKPHNLKKVNDVDLRSKETEETVEEYDGYLEPINRNFELEQNAKNDTSFLSKYKKDTATIETEPQNIKTKSFKDRPLPPLPPVKTFNVPVTNVENIEDYAPVLEIEEQEIPAYIHADEELEEFVPVSKRPLPPIPVDNEELPEYTSVIEEEEEVATHVISKPTVFRRPPPPEPYFKNNSSFKKTVSSSFKTKTQAIKPPIKLPKPPFELPQLPMPILPCEKVSSSQIQALPLPTADALEDEEEEVNEDVLKDTPCYREIDRKGAKMLLTGLEEGAFIIRPSRQSKYVCTLSIMHTKKMFNVGIEQGENGMLVFGSTSGEIKHPAFYTVKDLVAYYMIYPLHMYGEYIVLKNVLPAHKR